MYSWCSLTPTQSKALNERQRHTLNLLLLKNFCSRLFFSVLNSLPTYIIICNVFIAKLLKHKVCRLFVTYVIIGSFATKSRQCLSLEEF